MSQYHSLKIGDKTSRLPLIQGGMGIGISLGCLAGTVAREGGVGIISAAQIGFQEPDFDHNPLAANLRAMGKELERARQLSEGGIVGFNIMVAMKHYEEYAREAAALGADLIISGAGLPTDLPKAVGSSKIPLAPIVSTNKSANVILKYWDRKHKRIPDLLVVEGPKAGGHLGFTREQLEQFDIPSYEQEFHKILNTVRDYEVKYSKKIPVILAGGIDTAQKVQRALTLGADGIQVATRFVTTEECDADIRYKASYIQASRKDIIIVQSPVGMPGRAIRNSFIQRVLKGEKIPHGCRGCLRKCSPTEIPYCITEALIHAARGEVEDALLFCGADAYQAEKIETVKEVIQDLFPIISE